jgi:hypothetical protein
MRRLALALATMACALFPATAGASLGTTTVFATSNSDNGPGVAQDYRATAATSEIVDRLSVYLRGTASRVAIGLYTGTTSTAQTLQRSCTVTSPVAGWNRCTINPYQVTAGATYWLAVMQPSKTAGQLVYSEGVLSGGQSYVARGRGRGSLPATWSNGRGWSGYGASLYADQTGTQPPPPPDTTPPDTSITGHPTDGTTSTDATFTFTATEVGSTFTCSLDGIDAACASPKTYTGLAVGRHTFVVAATDAAQNTDPTPPTFTWTINPPVTPPTGNCAVTTPNVPDGPDPAGGCFPGPSNTGVPNGTNLTAYTGPCTITAPNTVIDSKTVNCSPLVVGSTASGLLIENSQVNGGVIQNSGSASFTIQDSTIDNAVSFPACTSPSSCAAGKYACADVNNATSQCGVGYQNFTIRRTEIMHTSRAAYCASHCTISDNYFHGTNLWPDHTNRAHASSTRVEQYTTLTHNTLSCDYQGPFGNSDIGCSADMTGYPDFAPIHDNTITGNLMMSNNIGIGFCAYGGGTQGKPYSGSASNATYVVFRNNVFQRGMNGKCGAYGPVTDFIAGRIGNVWDSNHWDTGELVPSG